MKRVLNELYRSTIIAIAPAIALKAGVVVKIKKIFASSALEYWTNESTPDTTESSTEIYPKPVTICLTIGMFLYRLVSGD